jgi:hypothetical protein
MERGPDGQQCVQLDTRSYEATPGPLDQEGGGTCLMQPEPGGPA